MKTLLVLLVVTALVAGTLAKRKKQKDACRYKKGQNKWTDCVDGTMTITKTLKEGSGSHCEQTNVVTRACGKSKCKYSKADWSECKEDGTQTRTMTLLKGTGCEATKTKSRTCKKVPGCRYKYKVRFSKCGKGVKSQTRVVQLKKQTKKAVGTCPQTLTETRKCRGCKYEKGNWGVCDPTSNKMTRKLTLVEGGDHCEQVKTREKKCRKAKKGGRKACKYKRGPWSPCNHQTNKMQRKMTLKRGDRTHCQPVKLVSKKCKRRAALTAAKFQSRCKYEPADWQECDLRTNTMTRTLKLVSGDPSKCASTKEMKRKCRKPCKFRKGRWSACDPSTHLMTRVDKLVKGDKMFCSNSRQITKKCKKGKRKCQYDIGDWSECDSTTQKRTRTKTLKKGDPKICKATIDMVKACSRPNGKERCFFGKWGEYGPCMNGVMTKTRELIQGGTECERKAVKTKACS